MYANLYRKRGRGVIMYFRQLKGRVRRRCPYHKAINERYQSKSKGPKEEGKKEQRRGWAFGMGA
jgi:hypothetical protein